MLYCKNPEAEVPVMLLLSHVGKDEIEGDGVLGDKFLEELMYLDSLGKSAIEVWINSPGGVVTDGMAIYHAILSSKTPVDTYCIGMAASISAVIFEAGRKRIMNDFGILMFHNAHGGDDKSLENFNEAINIMVQRSGLKPDEITNIMDEETWINGSDTKFKGVFWDETRTSGEKTPPTKTSDLKAVWGDFRKINNSLLINKTENQMKKSVCKYLGISENSTDEEINSALVKKEAEVLDAKKNAEEEHEVLEQKILEMEKALIVLKEQLEAAEKKTGTEPTEESKKLASKCESLQAEVDDLKKAIDEDRKAKNEADENSKKAEADNVVKKAVEDGKMASDETTTNYWKTQLVKNMVETKAVIEKLPINKAGVSLTKLVLKDENGNDIKPTTAQNKLAVIKAKWDKRQSEF